MSDGTIAHVTVHILTHMKGLSHIVYFKGDILYIHSQQYRTIRGHINKGRDVVLD